MSRVDTVSSILEGLNLIKESSLDSIIGGVKKLLSKYALIDKSEQDIIINKISKLEKFVESYPFFAMTINKKNDLYEKEIIYEEGIGITGGLVKDHEKSMIRLGIPVDNVRRFNPNSRSRFTSAEYDIGENNFLGIQIEIEPNANGQGSVLYMTVGVYKRLKALH